MKPNYFLIMGLLILSVGCVQEPSRSRQLIDAKASTIPAGLCTKAVLYTDPTACYESCPTGTYAGTTTEITSLTDAKQLPAEELAEFELSLSQAQTICLEENLLPTRPTGQIEIQSGFCSCINGKPDIIASSACTTMCAEKTATAIPTLYMTAKVSPTIELQFGGIYNWCTQSIDDGLGAPACYLKITTASGDTKYLNVNLDPSSNSFSANLSDSSIGVNYTFQLIEKISGAVSSTKNFYRIAQTTEESTKGTLKVTSTAQYTCYMRSMQVDSNNNVIYDLAVPLHYIYPLGDEPEALPPSQLNQVLCHDAQDPSYSTYDSSLYPRLDLIAHHFSLWDILKDDRLVETSTGSNNPQINTILANRLIAEYNYGSTTSVNLFYYLKKEKGPVITSSSTVSTSLNNGYVQGVVLKSFKDSTTNLNYCPNSTNYGKDALFTLLQEYIGVDTEGLYIAKRDPMVFSDSSGTVQSAPDDYMFIRESDLHKIWFYMAGGKPYIPTNASALGKTIKFYWPIVAGADPRVKTGDQVLYTVKSTSELTGSSIPTATAHDKRIGCVPNLLGSD